MIISDRRKGPARLSVAGEEQPVWLADWPLAESVGSHYVHFATSPSYVVAADLAFGLRWREQRVHAPIEQEMFEYIADLDVQGDQLLISGLRRGTGGELGGDSTTAWLASLRDHPLRLRPVLPFRSLRTIENCAGFGLTAVRFLPGGGFLIVPGAEPGVYLYGADQRLQRTWDTKALDLDIDCGLSREQASLLATDVDARQAWVNRRRIVDDVVAMGDVPALVVRFHDGGATRWELILLRGESTASRILPFTSPSPSAHVSADARGDRVAFLISDRLPKHEGSAAPRLVIVQWPAF